MGFDGRLFVTVKVPGAEVGLPEFPTVRIQKPLLEQHGWGNLIQHWITTKYPHQGYSNPTMGYEIVLDHTDIARLLNEIDCSERGATWTMWGDLLGNVHREELLFIKDTLEAALDQYVDAENFVWQADW